ncbi:hypothetical protein GDO81_002267 [Engystomops pustulosus]|uniref:Uncharacterized protein n=1 Tax=Engystomops pustulosus TaxID=76066 RepID=A0AAV7DIN8_ENGPU|nr:hypothetical protein GDO81_002267 [Engystomops pustulosus]
MVLKRLSSACVEARGSAALLVSSQDTRVGLSVTIKGGAGTPPLTPPLPLRDSTAWEKSPQECLQLLVAPSSSGKACS